MLAVLLAALMLQDPDAILKEMRSAQAAFERQRLINLPRANSDGSQRCDERIGEFCYWYDGREQLL
jgi:hypothetical protein